jgi:hypothetical protein
MMTSGGDKMKEPGKGTTTSANCKTPREQPERCTQISTAKVNATEPNSNERERETTRANNPSGQRAARPNNKVAANNKIHQREQPKCDGKTKTERCANKYRSNNNRTRDGEENKWVPARRETKRSVQNCKNRTIEAD